MHQILWQAASQVLSFPSLALAQNSTPAANTRVTKIKLFDPLGDVSISELLTRVLQGLTLLAIPVVTIMIMIGAYYMITSGGNSGKLEKGKGYVLWAVIGFAVLLLSTSVTTIITNWLKNTT